MTAKELAVRLQQNPNVEVKFYDSARDRFVDIVEVERGELRGEPIITVGELPAKTKIAASQAARGVSTPGKGVGDLFDSVFNKGSRF